jgi:methylthioribose-1-phosphate isomerase
MNIIRPIQLFEDTVTILDQTRLPREEVWLELVDYRQMIEAIKMLRVRGAPLLGLAAVATVILAAIKYISDDDFVKKMDAVCWEIDASRPTAVNLFKATSQARKILHGSINSREAMEGFRKLYTSLYEYEETACQRIGINGAGLFPQSKKLNLMTICNTGSLATVGIGTALGVIRTLHQDHEVQVFVTETRPLLQGSRLTMWELQKSGIPATLITDNMAGWVMKTNTIDAVLTGADRITANGDSANKIGTLNLAILAKYYNIPFYMVAPVTTIDSSLKSGSEILIEERDPGEVSSIGNQVIAPEGIEVFNPAFDITPASLIEGIITDKGVFKPPYQLDKFVLWG